MLVLGIETSCDETSVALLETPNKIVSSIVSSQIKFHAPYGGVVPEIASRRHMESICPLTTEVLKNAGLKLDRVEGIAVTRAPGLMGALLVGLSFAKSLAYSLKLPFIGVNHLEGHLNAVHLEHDDIKYPHIGLVVSGGHTSLYLVKKFGHYKLLGATRDDAAGEAFDKVAKLLGLGYPGGPIIDKVSKNGDPKRFRFTKPKMGSGSDFQIGEHDFSFSGLKTAVMSEFKKLTAPAVNDIAASFQKTVVDIIEAQIFAACERYKCRTIVVSGGVAANSLLRSSLQASAEKNNCKVYLPALQFCTDNAAMIAYVGGRRLVAGERDPLSISAKANEEICS